MYFIVSCHSGCISCPMPVNTGLWPWWVSYYFLITETHKPYWFNYNCLTLSLLLFIHYVFIFLQAQPIRKAQWWEYCVVWAPWPEHWVQLCHPLVRETHSNERKKNVCILWSRSRQTWATKDFEATLCDCFSTIHEIIQKSAVA